jgi:hypothetical protein
MHTFTEPESKLVLKLRNLPAKTILKIQEPCPLHSVCNPLPLFRVYKIDDEMFEAEWNSFHQIGMKQVFPFGEI